MAVTHGNVTKKAIADAVLARIDAGAGAGKLVFRTSAAAALATNALTNPAAPAASSVGVLNFSAIADATAAAGTVSNFTLEDDAGVTIFAGNVLTSGGDINLSSLTLNAGDTVSVSSLTYTAPA